MEHVELNKIRERLKQKVSDKTHTVCEEPKDTIFGMFMYRLGFVSRKRHEELSCKYDRLYRRYVGKRMEMDHIVQNCVIGDSDVYELVRRARKSGAA